MWNAGTAFLASTTAMHATMLAYSFYLEPTSAGSKRRVYLAAFFFAAGALFAWPFALLLSIPFVLEELFVGGKDVVLPKEVAPWRVKRVTRFVGAALVAGLVAVSLGPHVLPPFRPTLILLARGRTRSRSSRSTRSHTAG
jgi:alpha-1,2-mannosyltransferase